MAKLLFKIRGNHKLLSSMQPGLIKYLDEVELKHNLKFERQMIPNEYLFILNGITNGQAEELKKEQVATNWGHKALLKLLFLKVSSTIELDKPEKKEDDKNGNN